MNRIDHKSLARFYAWLRHIRTWQLVIVLILSLGVTASLLRLNNLRMDELRAAVIAADTSGDVASIKQTLVDLQTYVNQHMNTSLGKGVYLEQSYNRDRQAALDASTDSTNPKAAVYEQASVECRSRFTNNGQVVYSNEYVACVVDRLRALGASSDDPTTLQLPLPDHYHYNFASPIISLDIAGVGVLFSFFLTSVIVIRILVAVLLRFLLRHRFKSI